MTQDILKTQLIEALSAWIRQRPGLEYGNYGDVASYRAELRSIQRDLHDARSLLRSVELSGITGTQLLNAFSAYSGRMEWKDGHVEYRTGQYWPTEYRKVVAAICAEALWDYRRQDVPQEEEHKGEWLRRSFRREYGKRIQSRWFN